MNERLFALPEATLPEAAPCEEPLVGAVADDIRGALRKRHPGRTVGGMVGQWTCIEEWLGIDLLALNAWQKADVIGYEIKVSRSDLRRELLKPHKRQQALARTTEFYFAMPHGLLTDEEIAYQEPDWGEEDFQRTRCLGVPRFGPVRRGGTKAYGGQCFKQGRGGYRVRVTVPNVIVAPDWLSRREGESDLAFVARVTSLITSYGTYVPCWTCDGRGYVAKSRVEREAPTCWVPQDVGLITISTRGCRIVKRSPKRRDPKPIAATRRQLNDLVRWVSHRPDPRH